MRVIGITGGIGAGKSVVSRVLRSKGFEVYDCDFEARRIMEESDELKSAIAARLGDECIRGDGTLDRRMIARLVFGDDSHRLWLNGRVHGMVRQDVERRVAASAGEILFVESAIFRTSGLDSICDSIWIVDAPESVRIRRACERDCSSIDAVMSRIEAQQNELTGFSGITVHAICNDGQTPLLPQIEKLLRNQDK